ncbi:MAG: S8 family serine peptidase [Solirubrobacterales bacterium]|nr:S8 family serine peptidase [Solirubrobacterales bacterium]
MSLAVGGIAVAARSSHHHVFRGKRSVLSAAEIRRLSAHATHHTIIIFKNQLSNLPARPGRSARARASAVSASQARVRAELAAVHATHVQGFQLINAVAATISSAEINRLQANPAVQAVVPDTFRHFASLGSGPGPALPAGPNAQAAPPMQICPSNPAQPLIEPEARTVMNVDPAEQIVDGTGVKVGIIADGIDPNNPDLIRANGQHVIFDYQDFSGFGLGAPTDGREAFLDAGTIASQANQTYDLSGFVNPAHPLPPGCNIKIKGIAPGASLAVLNLSGPNPGFFNSTIIQAIQWAVLHDHVNVLNESIGGNPIPNTEDDPVALADQAAVAAGVTVVASSGDAGPFNNIGSPATTPGVIAAGGSTTYRVYRQTTRYGTQLVPGGWENNNISALSSSGTTEFNPATVNVVAPGDRGWSLCSSNTTAFFGCADIDHGSNPPPIWAAGGTSASAPETSGTAALVIEAYANTHGGATPSPALVKQIIVSTATDLGAPADHQGAGLVNTLKAVQLAESINGAKPQGSTLLVHQPALSATVDAGQSHVFNVDVTNEGSGAQTVTPTVTGRPTTISDDTGSVTLASSSPTYIDGEGRTDFYAVRTFSVPAGTDNLNGNITWNDQTIGGVAFETLFDPQGNVAAYSLIGTDQSGFGHVEVRKPAAGTWTAVIFTVSNAPYFGPVQFSYSTEKFHPVGSVTPSSLTLAPGQQGTFHVSVTAGQAGDESLNLHLGTGGSDDGSIPVVLRALVPLTARGGAFSGTLTGGGSTGNASQEFTYQFNVPGGKPSLNVGVVLRDPNYGLEGFLVDPNGEPLDAQTTANDALAPGPTMQFFRGRPQAGMWTLVLLTALPVDGAHLSEPFAGSVDFAPPAITSIGLPHSARTVLAAGHPVTATITVTNTGNIAKDFFADPRLTKRAQLPLLGSDVNNVPLPLSLSAQPNWLVPPGTNSLTVAAQGTAPITMDVSWAFGDPDFLGGSFGNFSLARLNAPEVAPGFFFGLPEATGPFTSATTATVNLAAIANTNQFDSAVSSSSGDVWAQSVDASAPYTPITLAPGQSGTITLTITPNAPKHSVVHGFVGVDTLNLATASGDELIKIPYTYKVG